MKYDGRLFHFFICLKLDLWFAELFKTEMFQLLIKYPRTTTMTKFNESHFYLTSWHTQDSNSVLEAASCLLFALSCSPRRQTEPELEKLKTGMTEVNSGVKCSEAS